MTALSDAFARMTEDGHLRPCDPRVAAEHFAFLVMGADLDRGTFTGERALAVLGSHVGNTRLRGVPLMAVWWR